MGQSKLYQLGFGSMVANLVDFHLMGSSSSEGNITTLSINEVIVLTSEVLTFVTLFELCT